MELSPDVLDDLRSRLHRVVGQVQGIERMLDDGRDCRDVVTQLAAARAALEQTGFRMVSAQVANCVAEAADPDDVAARLVELEKLFLRLA